MQKVTLFYTDTRRTFLSRFLTFWRFFIYFQRFHVYAYKLVCRDGELSTSGLDGRSTNHMHRLHSMRLRPIAVDRVAWSVCRCVCLSVCLLVTIVSVAKTAEPIQIPFGVRSLGAKEPCIWWAPDNTERRALLRGMFAVDILTVIRQGAAAMRPLVNSLL